MAREPVLPTLRAAVFAAVCLGLGAGAHLTMSGAAIPAWALVLGAVGAHVPARYAAGRGEGGLPVIVGLMGGLQVAFHVLFSFAQHAAGAASASVAAAMPGMSTPKMPTMPTGMWMPAGMSMPGMPAGATSSTAGLHFPVAGTGTGTAGGSGMLLAHVLAALVCAWWLRRGEAAVHAVIRRAVFRLREVWVVTVFAPVLADDSNPTSANVATQPRTLRSQWRRGTPAQRGPPHPAPAHV